jgi:hypothetical protein
MAEQFLLDRVLVEPGDRAQPASNRRPGAPAGLEVAAEALDVRAADAEQPHLVARAPGRELAQIWPGLMASSSIGRTWTPVGNPAVAIKVWVPTGAGSPPASANAFSIASGG